MPRKLSTIAAAVALVAIIVAFVVFYKPGAKTPAAEQPNVKNDGLTFKAGVKPSLEIDPTQTAGDTVTVAKVDVPLAAFVVIRDASSNKIIGASSVVVPPGSTDIKISTPTTAGKTYSAELHADGDNNGVFDAKVDPPFLISGKTVNASFKVK